MAHFYGRIKGSRGEASRLGTKQSGISVTAAGWGGAIEVALWVDKEGRDRYAVAARQWHGAGEHAHLASGIVGEAPQKAENPVNAELLAALEYVMEDDGLLPRATSNCRKVVAAVIARAKGAA